MSFFLGNPMSHLSVLKNYILNGAMVVSYWVNQVLMRAGYEQHLGAPEPSQVKEVM